VHAEAWARRLCRSGDRQADLLVKRLRETWEHAARWTGPADDPGTLAALELGMFTPGPAEQREMMRRWLVALLEANGRSITLADPTDWTGWDPAARRWAP
jgi:hypothetical protein